MSANLRFSAASAASGGRRHVVDYDFGTDCGGGSLTSCRNNPPAVENLRPLKIMTSSTFEGLDALSLLVVTSS